MTHAGLSDVVTLRASPLRGSFQIAGAICRTVTFDSAGHTDPIKKATLWVAFFVELARLARFERATAWFVARYSIQLSYGRLILMAEREGFEPSIRVNVYTLSRGAPSATRPPLLINGAYSTREVTKVKP